VAVSANQTLDFEAICVLTTDLPDSTVHRRRRYRRTTTSKQASMRIGYIMYIWYILVFYIGDEDSVEMVTLELATRLEPFDAKTETSVIGQRWNRWMRSFTYYVQARGLTDAEQKKALLLHLAGQDVQDIFETLPEGGEEGDNVYDQTVSALNTYFQPHVNIPYERHVFRQITQSETESIDQFATRLMQQASRCEFADDKEQIRDQIIDKCYSAQLRKALLEKKDITFDKVLEMGRANEAAQRQAQAIE